jgi:uncharacterized UPF0160 family protein
MKRLVTHNGNFHADDVFATATLFLLYGKESCELIRTRDEGVFATADIIYDVGGVYDAERNTFDHHQTEGAGERENGVPYAAFGLIWKHFGPELVSSDVLEGVDESLVQPIDANDTGFFDNAATIEEFSNVTPDILVKYFNPTWKEGYEHADEKFLMCVDVAMKILERQIERTQAGIEANEKITATYNASEDKEIIVFDQGYPWKKVLLDFPEPKFVIIPNKMGGYLIQAVPVAKTGYENRVSFPAAWGGLRADELQSISNVADATFCHRAGFLAGSETKKGAIELAKQALNLYVDKNKSENS